MRVLRGWKTTNQLRFRVSPSSGEILNKKIDLPIHSPKLGEAGDDSGFLVGKLTDFGIVLLVEKFVLGFDSNLLGVLIMIPKT